MEMKQDNLTGLSSFHQNISSWDSGILYQNYTLHYLI